MMLCVLPVFQTRRGQRRLLPPRVMDGAMLLMAGATILLGMLGRASGWEECLISPDDEWIPVPPSVASALNRDYRRRYTCPFSEGKISMISGGVRGGGRGEDCVGLGSRLFKYSTVVVTTDLRDLCRIGKVQVINGTVKKQKLYKVQQ